MKSTCILPVSLAVTLAACTPETPPDADKAPPASAATVVHCGTLIDGISGAPRTNQVITIVDE